MNTELDKYLQVSRDTSVAYTPGGYDGRVFSKDAYDEDYLRFKRNKYGDSPQPYQVGGFEELGFKSIDDKDRAEYDKKVNDFGYTTAHINKIENTHIPIAWSLRNINNDRARRALRALNGELSFGEVQSKYDEDLYELSRKYGVNVGDIHEWEQRNWRGAITGTTEVLNDMRDVGVSAGAGASVVVGGSAIVGGIVGTIAGPEGTLPGAAAGAKVGMKISQKTAFPIAVFRDSYIKEAGGMAADYMANNPNASPQEIKDLKKSAALYGVGAGLIEAGMAEFIGPYIGKVALALPGAKKIAGPMLEGAVKKTVENFAEFSKTAAFKEFSKEASKLVGWEITTEEMQYGLELFATEYVRNNAEIDLERRLANFEGTPEEKAKLEKELTSRREQKETAQSIAVGAGKTASQTFQSSILLGAVGAGAAVKAKTYNQIADNVNEKLDAIDAQAGLVPDKQEKAKEQAETKQESVLKGGVEKNEYEGMDTKQLTKEEANLEVSIKEKENQISTTQERLDRAEDLGLGEDEKLALEKDIFNLKKEKDEQVDQMRLVGTEKAIKQATEQTNAELEVTNDKIEKTNNDIEKNDAKLEAAKKAGKDTTKLEARAKKLDESLGKLEAKQEQLLSDKTKLEKREDVESVLKGKKTKIGSNVLANIEKRAEEAVAKSDAKAMAKINKIRENAVVAKVKALAKSIREQQNQYVKGYTTGTKEQIQETKDIRKTLYRVLREQGIHRKELYKFDTITKGITTLQDLEASQKDIVKKIREVFEERSKTAALKKTEQLMKLAKPFKAGKTPKGKMTADIQNKVNRLFSFVPRQMFDVGFDIQELLNRFGKNPNEELTAEEREKLVDEGWKKALSKNEEKIADNNSEIVNNQNKINELKNDKIKGKTKWQGAKQNRPGTIKGENLENAVGKIDVEIPKEIQDPTLIKTIHEKLNDRVASILNIMNMGLTFNNLKIDIRDSVFHKGMDVKQSYGMFDPKTNILTIEKDAENTIPHELGHYFDMLVAEAIGYKGEHFSTIINIKDKALKPVMQKLAVLIKAEKSRIKKDAGFAGISKDTTLSEEQRQEYKNYLLGDKEVFARIFNALYNKISGETVKVPEGLEGSSRVIYDLTNSVSEQTLKDFESVLNDLAKYKEIGMPIHEMEQQNEQLEQQNEQLEQQNKTIRKEEMYASLPETISELIYELELAADLKNKSAADIMKFNDYVETLIREGRDERQQKLDAQKERREKSIEELKGKIEKYAPKAKDNKLHINKFLELYNYIGANWKSKLNMFFGKDIAEQFNVIKEETERDSFVFEEKAKFRQKAKEIYGFKDIAEMGKLTAEYTADRDIYMANEKDGKVKTRLDKMQVISAWIYYQNEEGRARLENMYDPMELDRMFSKLNDKDKAFADLMIDTAESYYDRVNAIFREDRGLDLPRRERYFPFAVDKTVTDIPTFMDSSFGTVGGLPSFTKTVTSSKNIALDLTNPLSTLFAHISNVGEYLYLYPKTKEIGIIFNDDRIKRRVRLLYGEKNFKNFYAMVNAISLASRMRDNFRIVGFWDNMASKYIVSKIALKPTIAIKQLLSFVNYAEDIPVAAFMKYQADFFKNPVASIKFMMNDKYLQSRFGQGSEAFELSRALEDSQYKKTGKFVDWLTLNVRLGDIGAICLGGYSQVKYLMNEKGMTKEQAFMKFRESTANSQQFGSTSSLSNIQNYGRSNGFARMFFAFSNTPFQYHRKLVDAAIQVSRGEMSKTDFAKTVAIYQFINPLLYTWATSLTPLKYLLADDDEDKEEAREELLLDTVGGVLTANMNLIPLFTDIPNDIFMRATGQKQYPVDAIPFGRESRHIVNTTVDLIRLSLQGDFEDIKVDDVLKAINDGGAMWKGLPLDYATSAVDGVVKLRDEEARLQGMLQLAGYTSKRSEAIAKYAK